MKTISKLFFAVAAVAAVPVFAACGGDIGAGKFVEYRLAAVATPKTSGSCQVDATHTTNLQNGSSVLIYGIAGTAGDQLFLDLGSKEGVIAGAKQDDGSYLFKGTTTDLQVNGQTQITVQTTLTVAFTADGKTITGDTVVDVKTSCAGPQCGQNPGGECTQTFNFSGVEVPDPDAPAP